jgi:hypothetical protein
MKYKNASDYPAFVRPGDVRRFVPIGRSTLYVGIRDGSIRAHKFGGATMVDLHHLLDSIASSPLA